MTLGGFDRESKGCLGPTTAGRSSGGTRRQWEADLADQHEKFVPDTAAELWQHLQDEREAAGQNAVTRATLGRAPEIQPKRDLVCPFCHRT